MVARTRGWIKLEELPSISADIQKQTEAAQSDIKKQLEHANEQLKLADTYPGRRQTGR